VKRVQVVELPESVAKRYIANGFVTAKHMKCPVEELPPGGEVTEETKALEQWTRQNTPRQINEESGPLPVGHVGPAYSRGKVEGWV